MRECPTCGRLFNADDARVCPDDSSALVPMGEADPLLGRQVGNYKLKRRIGRGGMGTVYEAVQPTIGSAVAVKVLQRKFADDPAVVERFFNEARAVNLIGHENIVRVFDFGVLDEGTPYFVMELLRGRPLTELCGQPRSPEEVLPIVTQIAPALRAAHAAGVVHRDLKPDNIFLVEGEGGPRVKVLDFGIAKLVTLPGVKHTESGAVLGSAKYLSPEQAAGDREKIGPRSDVYSLGVILFELLCGRVPFEATTYGDLLVAQRTQAPPVPRKLVPSIPPWLSDVVLRCLAKQPEARFESMEALLTALDPRAKPIRTSPMPRKYVAIVVGFSVLVFGGNIAWARYLRAHPIRETSDGGPLLRAESAPLADANVASPHPIIVAVPPTPAAEAKPSPVVEAKPPTTPPKPLSRKPAEPRYTIPAKVGDGMIDVEF